ncbi:hypothetical protein ACM66B_006047 [Microbotryomycetes sp. NB124-2]
MQPKAGSSKELDDTMTSKDNDAADFSTSKSEHTLSECVRGPSDNMLAAASRYLRYVATSSAWSKPNMTHREAAEVFQQQFALEQTTKYKPPAVMPWESKLVHGFKDVVKSACFVTKAMMSTNTNASSTFDLHFWSQPVDTVAAQLCIPLITDTEMQQRILTFKASGDVVAFKKGLKKIERGEKRGGVYLKIGKPSEFYGGNLVAMLFIIGLYVGQSICLHLRMIAHNTQARALGKPVEERGTVKPQFCHTFLFGDSAVARANKFPRDPDVDTFVIAFLPSAFVTTAVARNALEMIVIVMFSTFASDCQFPKIVATHCPHVEKWAGLNKQVPVMPDRFSNTYDPGEQLAATVVAMANEQGVDFRLTRCSEPAKSYYMFLPYSSAIAEMSSKLVVYVSEKDFQAMDCPTHLKVRLSAKETVIVTVSETGEEAVVGKHFLLGIAFWDWLRDRDTPLERPRVEAARRPVVDEDEGRVIPVTVYACHAADACVSVPMTGYDLLNHFTVFFNAAGMKTTGIPVLEDDEPKFSWQACFTTTKPYKIKFLSVASGDPTVDLVDAAFELTAVLSSAKAKDVTAWIDCLIRAWDNKPMAIPASLTLGVKKQSASGASTATTSSTSTATTSSTSTATTKGNTTTKGKATTTKGKTTTNEKPAVVRKRSKMHAAPAQTKSALPKTKKLKK